MPRSRSSGPIGRQPRRAEGSDGEALLRAVEAAGTQRAGLRPGPGRGGGPGAPRGGRCEALGAGRGCRGGVGAGGAAHAHAGSARGHGGSLARLRGRTPDARSTPAAPRGAPGRLSGDGVGAAPERDAPRAARRADAGDYDAGLPREACAPLASRVDRHLARTPHAARQRDPVHLPLRAQRRRACAHAGRPGLGRARRGGLPDGPPSSTRRAGTRPRAIPRSYARTWLA